MPVLHGIGVVEFNTEATENTEYVMDPRHLPIDERLTGYCVYCGERPDTRDHVPSKCLLDEPFPDHLPVVEACASCNSGFAKDEEYLACFLDCILCGTTDPDRLERERVQRALSRNSSFARMLEDCKQTDTDGRIIWQPQYERIYRVVLKLARGHAAYELSLPQLDDPTEVSFLPFLQMTEQDRVEFEMPTGGMLQGWPEVGSRAFHRACGDQPDSLQQVDKWIVVQPGRYRYCVAQTGGILVQMVLSDYLACRVEWD